VTFLWVGAGRYNGELREEGGKHTNHAGGVLLVRMWRILGRVTTNGIRGRKGVGGLKIANVGAQGESFRVTRKNELLSKVVGHSHKRRKKRNRGVCLPFIKVVVV